MSHERKVIYELLVVNVIRRIAVLCCPVQGEPREADVRAAEAGGLPGPGEGAEGESSEGECRSHAASDLSVFNLPH